MQVALHERIYITYKQRGNNDIEKELPLKVLIMGNLKGNGHDEVDTPVAERAITNIDKKTFYIAMAKAGVILNTHIDKHVPISQRIAARYTDVPQPQPQTRDIRLRFNSLEDFNPDAILRQVPELRQMVKLRNLLTDFKNSY